MTRVLARAALMAVVAAFALTQLESEQELLVWELLLLGIVIWQVRGIPGMLEARDPPLFDLSPREQKRLPRAVSSMELIVIDAVSGHLGPERRLQPTVSRLAVHRLQRQGIDFESESAVERLGEVEWSWLADPRSGGTTPDMLDGIVSKLESL